jgi:hypothetical protein
VTARIVLKELRLGRERAARITGVERTGGFDQQNGCLLVGPRAMLDTSRHDGDFSRVELDRSIAELNR